MLYCSGSMCVGVTVWFGWDGVVSLCRLQPEKSELFGVKPVLLVLCSTPMSDEMAWNRTQASFVKKYDLPLHE